jgi:hypothetical protein
MDTRDWFLIHSCAVDSLGRGELFQSLGYPDKFKAKLILNNYESNCLRDWLAQRWKSRSLDRACLYFSENNTISITVPVFSETIPNSKEIFKNWLIYVASERVLSIQSRK